MPEEELDLVEEEELDEEDEAIEAAELCCRWSRMKPANVRNAASSRTAMADAGAAAVAGAIAAAAIGRTARRAMCAPVQDGIASIEGGEVAAPNSVSESEGGEEAATASFEREPRPDGQFNGQPGEGGPRRRRRRRRGRRGGNREQLARHAPAADGEVPASSSPASVDYSTGRDR